MTAIVKRLCDLVDRTMQRTARPAAIDGVAREYEEAIMHAVRSNAPFEKGMWVSVYAYSYDRRFVGSGTVENCEWSDVHRQHLTTVRFIDGSVEHNFPTSMVERLPADHVRRLAVGRVGVIPMWESSKCR